MTASPEKASQSLTLGDGRHIAFELISGDDHKPTLVFLHDGLGSIGIWNRFPHALCARTACPGLVYDRAGHGRSSPLAEQRNGSYLQRAANSELPEVLAHLAPAAPHILIGHSDGGTIALLCAADNNPLLRGLVCEAPHIMVEEVTLAGIRSAVMAYRTGRLDGLRRHHGDKTDALFYAWADTWLDPAFRHWTINDRLADIRCPVLAIQGDADPYGTVAQVDGIVSAVSGPARRLVLEGCGHVPHQERRGDVLDLMSAFVASVPRHSC